MILRYTLILFLIYLLSGCFGYCPTEPAEIRTLCPDYVNSPIGSERYGVRIKAILTKPEEGPQKILFKNYYLQTETFEHLVIEIDNKDYLISELTNEFYAPGCNELMIELPSNSFFPREEAIIRLKDSTKDHDYFQLAVYKNTSEGVWYSFEDDRNYD